MVLALTRVVVGIAMECVYAGSGAGLFELGAQRAGEDRAAEDTADIITG